MAWNLRIFLSGLFVVTSNMVEGFDGHEVVFVNAGKGDDLHECEMLLKGLSGQTESVKMTTHDIFILDGEKKITADLGSPGGSFQGLPQLKRIADACKNPRAGVLRPDFPIGDDVWSARIGLYGGSLFERDPTDEQWSVWQLTPLQVVDGPRTIRQTLLYEISIQSEVATIITVDRRSNEERWAVRPKTSGTVTGNNLEITIKNSSLVDPVLGSNGEAPHFGLAFDLFEPGPVGELRLHQPPVSTSNPPTNIQSVHIPCVGGCAC